MKVGTDAVVLGAWVNVDDANSILDIGTGCGVIALMLAQRTNAFVDAVEIDQTSADQAAENFNNSPFAGRLRIHNVPVQDFEGSYDLIVSNPPFFNNSLLPPATARQRARHTTSLSHEELVASATRLLAPGGRFAVIVPNASDELVEAAGRSGLHCCRMALVYPKQGKLERWLLEFSWAGHKHDTETLVLTEDGQKRTKQYAALAGEFYL